MTQHSKDLEWLKRNKEYLNLSAIATYTKDEQGKSLPIRIIHGVVKGQSDGHGTPFKIPTKYHTSLTNVINKIRK